QVAAERLGAKVTDPFLVPAVDRKLQMRIVGIVHKPGILAGVVQTVYVPLETLQKLMLPDTPNVVSRVLIDLSPGVDDAAFAKRWQQKLSAIDPNLNIRLSSENRKEMDNNLQGLRALSYLGGT